MLCMSSQAATGSHICPRWVGLGRRLMSAGFTVGMYQVRVRPIRHSLLVDDGVTPVAYCKVVAAPLGP